MGGFGFDPGQGNNRYSQGTPTKTKDVISPELARFFASVAQGSEAKPLPTVTPGFDAQRQIVEAMLKPHGNGTVTLKPDGTAAFKILPDQSPGGAANATTAAPTGSQYQWGDINATAMQAIDDANNAASGVDDLPVVEKTPQQHANEYLKMLEGLGSDEARVQFGLDPMGDGSVAGFLSEDAATMLRDGQGGLGEPAATSKYEWVDGKIKVKGVAKTPQQLCVEGGGTWVNGACDMGGGDDTVVDDTVVDDTVVDDTVVDDPVYVPPAGYIPPGDPAGTIETLSENARDVAQTRLDDTKTAITSMLNSGLLDIKTAQELYDTETERVWKDFLSTQNAVTSDFRNVSDAQRAQRYDDRMALEEQLRAAGVNPGLVGDRLDMTDAVAMAGAEERGAYLDDLGLVSQMADADRKFMGEGIFGGYKQDLRSRTNELGYGAETDRIGADYDARSQALQAADLAPFLGLDPRAVAAGLASGVDIPGLSTGISEAALDRALTVSEGGLDRAVDTDRLAEQIRQFDVGIDPATGLPYGFNTATGLDAGQTATLAAQGIDPSTGRQYGFDTATGLTAAEQVSAQQFADQIASTEGMAADKLDFAQKGLDLDWWEARGDQAAGVIDRQLEKNQFKLLEDKFDLADDQFAWDQAMDIAELGDQDFNLGTQLSLHAGSVEGGAAIMQEVADYMYNNNINADNTGYAHALAALGYGPVLTFLYTEQFMEDGTSQEVAEPLAEAAVDALEETRTTTGGYDSGAGNLSESESLEAGSSLSVKNEQMRRLREKGTTGNFEWGEGVSGAVGDAAAATGKAVGRFFQSGDSFTVPAGHEGAGTKYGDVELEAMMDILPANYPTVEEYILFQHSRGNTFGMLKANGKPGWGK
jgi:hypothetical protein